jgi:integrase
MKAKPYKRCGCRDYDGRQLGSKCPRLRGSRHGAWWIRLDAGLADNGRRRQVRLGPFTTAAEADAAGEAERVRLRRGGQPTTVTVGKYLADWLTGAADLRASTAHGYRGHIERYLTPYLGNLRLDKLRAEHIERMIADILAGNAERPRPVGPTTLHRIRGTLRSALSDAVKRRLIPDNPAKFVRLPSLERHEVEPWTGEELGQFLDAIADDRYAPLYELTALAGLRRGEVCGLRWDDVDLLNAIIVVRETRGQIGYEVVTGRPKTRGSERVVDLDDSLVNLLAWLKDRTDRERAECGDGYVDSGYVFVRRDGVPVHPEFVSRHLDRLIKRAKVRRITFHALRHCSASLQINAGVALTIVSKRLGHSSTGITSDLYGHLFRGAGRDAAERAAAMVPRRNRTVPTTCPPSQNSNDGAGEAERRRRSDKWGGSDSNRRPRDYESLALTH